MEGAAEERAATPARGRVNLHGRQAGNLVVITAVGSDVQACLHEK